MTAFPLEYRLRFFLYGLIYALGFYAPWERYSALSLGSSTWWLFLASFPAREHWLSFTASSLLLLILGCITAMAGALLRFWAASFLGAPVVHAGKLHGIRLLTDGPFRAVRNPLYLGAFLSTLALSLLMPPTGAIVTVLLLIVLQLRLIGAEEAFLLQRFGEPYRAYCGVVPRLLPTWRHRLPFAGTHPDYRGGLLSEVFAIGIALSFITVGWNFNSTIVIKGVLISLGLALIARAFIPGITESSAALHTQ